MARTIAIGDIHGCSKTFFELLQQLDIAEDDNIYLLGDIIDKGPDSKGVLNTILALQQNGFNIHCLMGNHEQLMLDSEGGFFNFSQWIQNGGENTLENFGVDFFHELNPTYQHFFTHLPTHIITAENIFVHAGLNFANDDIFADEEAMLWIRGFEPLQTSLGNKLLVHGHTPMPLQQILQQQGNCINIDGGCVFAKLKEDMGYLVALILENMEYVYVKCLD